MDEYLVDHHRVVNASDYFDETGAFATFIILLEKLLLADCS